MVLPVLPIIFAEPLIVIGLPDRFSWQQTILCLALLNLVAVLWIHFLREAVGGGDFRRYIETLPLSRGALTRLDAFVVGIAGWPFFLVVLTALILMPEGRLSGDEIVQCCLRMAVVSVLFVAAQVLYLQKPVGMITVLAIGDAVLFATGRAPYPLGFTVLLVFGGALAFVLAGGHLPPRVLGAGP
ncbi:MAG: hypothetical protein CSB44_11510 [Gammaproteobacteria bacterium]|nr:MAG: hypothetical protein CSB44_11510 [Gammaproteobacteria bacterium]